jgi:hypothetical protein
VGEFTLPPVSDALSGRRFPCRVFLMWSSC